MSTPSLRYYGTENGRLPIASQFARYTNAPPDVSLLLALEAQPEAVPVLAPNPEQEQQLSPPKKKRLLGFLSSKNTASTTRDSLRGLQASLGKLKIAPKKRKRDITDDGHDNKENEPEPEASKPKRRKILDIKKRTKTVDNGDAWWKSAAAQSKPKPNARDSAVASTITLNKCNACPFASLMTCTHPAIESSSSFSSERRTPIPHIWHDEDWDESQRLREELLVWKATTTALEAMPQEPLQGPQS